MRPVRVSTEAMATDYDAPKTDDDVTDESLEELKARSTSRGQFQRGRR